jgi:hypothetical protein
VIPWSKNSFIMSSRVSPEATDFGFGVIRSSAVLIIQLYGDSDFPDNILKPDTTFLLPDLWPSRLDPRNLPIT